MRPGCELTADERFQPVITQANRVIWRPRHTDDTAMAALLFAAAMLDQVEAGACDLIPPVDA